MECSASSAESMARVSAVDDDLAPPWMPLAAASSATVAALPPPAFTVIERPRCLAPGRRAILADTVGAVRHPDAVPGRDDQPTRPVGIGGADGTPAQPAGPALPFRGGAILTTAKGHSPSALGRAPTRGDCVGHRTEVPLTLAFGDDRFGIGTVARLVVDLFALAADGALDIAGGGSCAAGCLCCGGCVCCGGGRCAHWFRCPMCLPRRRLSATRGRGRPNVRRTRPHGMPPAVDRACRRCIRGRSPAQSVAHRNPCRRPAAHIAAAGRICPGRPASGRVGNQANGAAGENCPGIRRRLASKHSPVPLSSGASMPISRIRSPAPSMSTVTVSPSATESTGYSRAGSRRGVAWRGAGCRRGTGCRRGSLTNKPGRRTVNR